MNNENSIKVQSWKSIVAQSLFPVLFSILFSLISPYQLIIFGVFAGLMVYLILVRRRSLHLNANEGKFRIEGEVSPSVVPINPYFLLLSVLSMAMSLIYSNVWASLDLNPGEALYMSLLLFPGVAVFSLIGLLYPLVEVWRHMMRSDWVEFDVSA